jgi:hypothetical protein
MAVMIWGEECWHFPGDNRTRMERIGWIYTDNILLGRNGIQDDTLSSSFPFIRSIGVPMPGAAQILNR